MSVPGRGIFCCKITSKEALVIIFNFCYTFLYFFKESAYIAPCPGNVGYRKLKLFNIIFIFQ